MIEPFSRKARPWEMKAKQLRSLLRLGDFQLLDPYLLAPKVGLTLMDMSSVPVDPSILSHLLDGAADQWSGGVYAKPLPDGTFLCILNPTHDFRRRRITLMEEISHVHLRHAPTGVRQLTNDLSLRDYDVDQEKEAYGVGAAALIPWRPLFADLNRGASIPELADKYEVSNALITYRISITGAMNLYKARQRNTC